MLILLCSLYILILFTCLFVLLILLPFYFFYIVFFYSTLYELYVKHSIKGNISYFPVFSVSNFFFLFCCFACLNNSSSLSIIFVLYRMSFRKHQEHCFLILLPPNMFMFNTHYFSASQLLICLI